MTPEYKNGYNRCIEDIIDIIYQAINLPKNGDTSVNDTLRLLRTKVLSISFQENK